MLALRVAVADFAAAAADVVAAAEFEANAQRSSQTRRKNFLHCGWVCGDGATNDGVDDARGNAHENEEQD
jgi:hypothetical protein